MKKILTSLSVAAIIFSAIPAIAAATTEVTNPHTLRFQPGDISNDYIAPRFGSIDIPDSGSLIYPYPDGTTMLTVDVPDIAYAGEPFSVTVSVKSLMTGPDDPNFGFWIHYPQVFAPAGVAGPENWSQTLNCYIAPGEPEIHSGAVAHVAPEWLSQPKWYDIGTLSYGHNGGTVAVGVNASTHGMGPWMWLQDSDEIVWEFSNFTAEETGQYAFEIYFANSMYQDNNHFEFGVEYEPVRFTVNAVDRILPVSVDIDPDTLNTKSKGNWVTVYAEADGWDVSLIDPTKAKLNGISAAPGSARIGDHDGDGVPDMMMKFSRDALISSLAGKGATVLELTGTAGSSGFTGSDIIRVI